jgi:ribonuclease BN (tRNA processing enzyme)
MDKIKTVKIKNPDGSVSEESYTISVDARNVDMDNGKDLQDTIGTIDIDTDGNIAEQLSKYKGYDNDIETLYADVDSLQVNTANLDDNMEDVLEITNKITSNIKYHFIKTGNNSGDCSLLELEGKNYLIDVSGKTTSTELENYFKNNNITKLDGIIISHYHGDHTGGASSQGFVALLNTKYVTSETIIYLPTDPDYSRFTDDNTNVVSRIQTIRTNIINACNTHNLTIINPITGDTIVNRNTILRFLNNDESSYEHYYNYLRDSNNNLTTHTNYNNFSLVVEVQNLNNTALFTGDIELAAQEQVEKYLHRKINLKKIEHHGVNHLADKNYLKKSSSYINICMNTIAFAENVNPGRYEAFAYMIKNGDKIYSVENNNSMVFIDNGYIIYQNSNLKNEEFILPNGVAGFIASGTNNFKNLGEISYRNFINEGDNLNDYMTPGDYVVNTASIAETLVNAPITTSAFKLTVEYNLNKDRLFQKVVRNSKNIEIYYRYYDSNGWND